MTEEKENKEEKKQEEQESKEKFNAVEVPTQTGLYIHDSEKDKLMNEKEVQAEILNRLARIENLLG